MASSSQLVPLSSPLGANSTAWSKPSTSLFARCAGPGARGSPKAPPRLCHGGRRRSRSCLAASLPV
eukprot:1363528-Alexandrium_andersonii.AAC.1